MIIVKNLVKAYKGHKVLDGISLGQAKGEKVVIIGPSGCGKTTLLRCLNQMEVFDSGTISVAGVTIDAALDHSSKAWKQSRHELRMRVGMVFQSFNLFPHMTALENITLAPVRVKGMHAAPARRLGADFLEKVGLGEKAGFYPSQLSGGQQQRVAIARALAMKPDVMLFDEPTSALDPEVKEDVLGVMRKLAYEGMTMLVITHEISFARDIADRVIFMEAGRVVETGPAKEIFLRPKEARTIEFLSKLLPRSPKLKTAVLVPDNQLSLEDLWD
ncbi:MAG: amino acid ABC transporter ATP-binding protein [Elusimicrobiota bacterium]|nr:amino acid ABC transporter ATP-binding protein [Elusimicrobiota bacterium]